MNYYFNCYRYVTSIVIVIIIVTITYYNYYHYSKVCQYCGAEQWRWVEL